MAISVASRALPGSTDLSKGNVKGNWREQTKEKTINTLNSISAIPWSCHVWYVALILLGITWVSLVAQRLKRLPPMLQTWVWSLGQEDPLEKEMVTHSSILAWRIPWMEKPHRLQSMKSQTVRHDWATSLSLYTEETANTIEDLFWFLARIALLVAMDSISSQNSVTVFSWRVFPASWGEEQHLKECLSPQQSSWNKKKCGQRKCR